MPRNLLSMSVVLVLLFPVAAHARDNEFSGSAFFARMGFWGLAYETSTRSGVGGFGAVGHAEFMGTGINSVFGNDVGVEADLDFGYSYFSDAEIFWVGPNTMNVVEASFGFPFSLISFATKRESDFKLRLQLSPGIGIGTLQAFGYLGARLTMQVAELVSLDLRYKWVPSVASHVWLAPAGLNSAYARVAIGVGDHSEKTGAIFIVYGEIVQSKYESRENGPLGLVSRVPYRNMLRIGVGMGF